MFHGKHLTMSTGNEDVHTVTIDLTEEEKQNLQNNNFDVLAQFDLNYFGHTIELPEVTMDQIMVEDGEITVEDKNELVATINSPFAVPPPPIHHPPATSTSSNQYHNTGSQKSYHSTKTYSTKKKRYKPPLMEQVKSEHCGEGGKIWISCCRDYEDSPNLLEDVMLHVLKVRKK